MKEFFLDAVEPFAIKEWPAAERACSNWLKVADVIYNTNDIDLLTRILQLELIIERRPLIVERVYARISSLRSKAEYDLFWQAPIAEVEPNKELDEVLRCWDTVLASLVNQEDILVWLRKLIYYEYNTKHRRYLLRRLLTKYQSLRREKELKSLYTWKPKKQSSDTCVTKSAN